MTGFGKKSQCFLAAAVLGLGLLGCSGSTESTDSESTGGRAASGGGTQDEDTGGSGAGAASGGSNDSGGSSSGGGTESDSGGSTSSGGATQAAGGSGGLGANQCSDDVSCQVGASCYAPGAFVPPICGAPDWCGQCACPTMPLVPAECESDADCPEERPACYRAEGSPLGSDGGTCVECLGDHQCTVGICSTDLECVAECEDDSQCDLNAECDEFQRCSFRTCTSNSDCSAASTCRDEGIAAICVSKTCSDGVCGEGQYCVGGACYESPGNCVFDAVP